VAAQFKRLPQAQVCQRSGQRGRVGSEGVLP